MKRKKQEGQSIQETKTLLDIDIRTVLEQLEAEYCTELPRKVITIDYDDEEDNLYIRFRNAEATMGIPTADGKTIIHFDKTGKIAALETIINL